MKPDESSKNYFKFTNANSYSELYTIQQNCHPFLQWRTSAKPWTFSVKANMVKRGWISNASSITLDNFHPQFDASIFHFLKSYEDHFIGQTVCDEFGNGSSGTNQFFDIATNPHDQTRTCGGSSSGAACAAAAIRNHVAIGTSTGGSIVVPAAFCGTYGFCPTYGAISRFGMIDYCSSLDKIGMISSRMDLVYKFFEAVSVDDKRDMTKRSVTRQNKIKLKRLVYLGRPNETPLEALIRDRMYEICSDYEIIEETFPLLEETFAAYLVTVFVELSSNLDRYGGPTLRPWAQKDVEDYHESVARFRGTHFTPEVLSRIVYGNALRMINPETHYLEHARDVVREIKEKFDAIFQYADFIISPTTPMIAPKFSEITQMSQLKKFEDIRFTIAPNLINYPHLSIPLGLYENMPIGGLVVGAGGDDYSVLDFGLKMYNDHPQSPERW